MLQGRTLRADNLLLFSLQFLTHLMEKSNGLDLKPGTFMSHGLQRAKKGKGGHSQAPGNPFTQISLLHRTKIVDCDD